MDWPRRTRALLCWCGLVGGAALAQTAAPTPVSVRVGLLAEAQPFHVWPQGGAPQGFDVDLLRRIEADTGMRFGLQRYERWSDLLADLAAGRVDLVTATARTADRDIWMAFTRPYARAAQGLAGSRDLTSVPSTPDLAGRRLALVRSFATEIIAAERFPLATRSLYDSSEQALDAVERGEADLVLGTAAGLRAVLSARVGTRLAVLRTFEFEQGQRRLATQVTNLALRERLDAAVAAIDPQVLAQWRARWLTPWETPNLPTLPPLAPGTAPAPLRVAYLPFDRPYSYTDAEGRADGIAVQFMSALAARAGVPVDRFVPLPLNEGLAALREGRVDAMLALTDTAERRPSMTFVGPYRDNPVVLVSRDVSPVLRLSQLIGRRLAMVRGYFAESVVRALHPEIELVGCDDFVDCMRLVADNRAEAALYGLQGTYGRLATHESLGLRVSAAVPEVLDEHSLGLALARADLAPRLRDAMAVALREDLPRIEREWHERDARPTIDWQRLRTAASVALAALLLLLLAWWWHSRTLRREIERTRAARADSDQYLAFMAHEVRNSLQSVAGAVSLLRSSSQPDARRATVMDALARSAGSTLALLNGLLDRHRLQAGRLSLMLRPESIERCLAALIDEVEPAALAKGLALRFERGSDLTGWWQIDALRVQQIVRNLLVNAVKFSEHGRIVLRAALGAAPRGDPWRRITIDVIDQGPGLAADQFDSVFDRMETKGGDRPGSGLGLNLSRELARALGGTLEATSRQGEGARFTLTFDAEPAHEPPRRGAVERVLVVEDSPVYALLLGQAFAALDVRVRQVDSVAAARDALCASVAGVGDAIEPAFDLVVSDMHLADGHALDLLRWMRNGARPGVTLPPVICISADFSQEEAARLHAAGALDLVTKDSDVAALVRLLLQRNVERQPPPATPPQAPSIRPS